MSPGLQPTIQHPELKNATTVLVIEDEPEILENLSELLEGEGYRVVRAADGRAGLEQARRHEPDLVVCDVMMPEVDGHEVLRALRAEATGAVTPFIFLTARTAKQDVRRGMDGGADDYLTKPFRAAELLEAVAGRLARHRALRRRQEEEIDVLRADLSTVIPHELRTPLSAVVGFSRFLTDDWDVIEERDAREMIGHIREAGERLERLVANYSLFAQLLDPRARPEDLAGTTPDVDAAVRAAALRTAHRADRTGDLELTLEAAALPLPEVYLAKLVEELVENACVFSEAGTPVTVCGRAKDGAYRLEVADRGRGMTAAQVTRVGAFRQFDRAAHEQQGLGLGLALARRLADLYGGEMTLDSVPDRGTTVAVRLPLHRHTTATV